MTLGICATQILLFFIGKTSGFNPGTFVYSVSTQRFSFFIVCLVNYLCEVHPWLAPKGKTLKFRSQDCWKLHFWQQFFVKFWSFMGSFMRLSFITQFKIQFLLPFTSCRKVLKKMPEHIVLMTMKLQMFLTCQGLF